MGILTPYEANLMPRVLVASRIFAPEPAAAAFRLKAVVSALAARDVSVDVRTTKAPPGFRPGPAQAGVVVRRAPVLRDRAGYVRGYLQYLSFDVPLALRLLTCRSFDVALVEPPPTTGLVVRTVLALRRRPYVYFAADLWATAMESGSFPGVVAHVVRWIEDRTLAGAAEVVAVSEEVADQIVARGGARPTVVGNGIDLTAFDPDALAAEDVLALTEQVPVGAGPILVYTGTASEVHGAEVFVTAATALREEHPDLRLVFLGQGTTFEALAADPDTPDWIVLIPRQAPRVAAAWLSRADVALASVADGPYSFAFPSKLVAAAAMGTVAVYAGTGAAAAWVRDGRTGYVCPWDADAAADAIRTALRTEAPDPQELRAWAQQTASLDIVGQRVADTLMRIGSGRKMRGSKR